MDGLQFLQIGDDYTCVKALFSLMYMCKYDGILFLVQSCYVPCNANTTVAFCVRIMTGENKRMVHLMKKGSYIIEQRCAKNAYKKSLVSQRLCGCHCWWTRGSPMAHVAKFYGRFVALWERTIFPCLILFEIITLWVYKTIPIDFSLFLHF